MANNPFASWEAYLDKIAEKARQIASLTVNAPLGTAAAAAASSGMVSTNVSTNVPVTGFTPPPTGTYGTPMGAVQGPQVIELKITGDGDLTNTIAQYDKSFREWDSIQGIPSLVNCLERKETFECHPNPLMVYNKVMEII